MRDAKDFQIISGPDKFDLMVSFFTIKPVKFLISAMLDENDGNEELEIYIHSLSIIGTHDGSQWNFTGVCANDRLQEKKVDGHFCANVRPPARSGWLRI